ncbi:MAG: hypothetical protein IK096_06150 [Lachnospiraceae bacterium]|nr:hypothetical protein [Lachnospiraceae bacterium]
MNNKTEKLERIKKSCRVGQIAAGGSTTLIDTGNGAVTAAGVLFWLFGQIFDIVLCEESPFVPEVMKKMRVNFILLTAVMFLVVGFGPALIAAFLFWCIYNIFDYGCLLQSESDETL